MADNWKIIAILISIIALALIFTGHLKLNIGLQSVADTGLTFRVESSDTTLDQCTSGTLATRKAAYPNYWHPNSCVVFTSSMVSCHNGLSTKSPPEIGRVGFPYYTHTPLTEEEQGLMNCYYGSPTTPPITPPTTQYVCDANADGQISREELGQTITKWVSG